MSGYVPKRVRSTRFRNYSNQVGLKMAGCPSTVGRRGLLVRTLGRRVNCNLKTCGLPRSGLRCLYGVGDAVGWDKDPDDIDMNSLPIKKYCKQVIGGRNGTYCQWPQPRNRQNAGGVGHIWTSRRNHCEQTCALGWQENYMLTHAPPAPARGDVVGGGDRPPTPPPSPPRGACCPPHTDGSNCMPNVVEADCPASWKWRKDKTCDECFGACCSGADDTLVCTTYPNDDGHNVACKAVPGSWTANKICYKDDSGGFKCPPPLGACCIGNNCTMCGGDLVPSGCTQQQCDTILPPRPPWHALVGGTFKPYEICGASTCPPVVDPGTCCYSDSVEPYKALCAMDDLSGCLYATNWNVAGLNFIPYHEPGWAQCDGSGCGACCNPQPDDSTYCQLTPQDPLDLTCDAWAAGQFCDDPTRLDGSSTCGTGACCKHVPDVAKPGSGCNDTSYNFQCPRSKPGDKWHSGASCIDVSCNDWGACCSSPLDCKDSVMKTACTPPDMFNHQHPCGDPSCPSCTLSNAAADGSKIDTANYDGTCTQCCLDQSPWCQNTTKNACKNTDQSFPDGSGCTITPCGACCIGDGCKVTISTLCNTAGGTGVANTSCSSKPCATGACCHANGDCSANIYSFDCKGEGLTFHKGSPCTPDPCTGPDPWPSYAPCENISCPPPSGTPVPTTPVWIDPPTPPETGYYIGSTTMYTPVESTNYNLATGCYGLSTSPIQCSADGTELPWPWGTSNNCGPIQLLGEKLARIPTPEDVLGWVVLAAASPMQTPNPQTFNTGCVGCWSSKKTAYAAPRSCWELSITKGVDPIPQTKNEWAQVDGGNPKCAAHAALDNTTHLTTCKTQKLYGVVLGSCPCGTTNSQWCCNCGNDLKCKTEYPGKEEKSPTNTTNHFDIWLPSCTESSHCKNSLGCDPVPRNYCPYAAAPPHGLVLPPYVGASSLCDPHTAPVPPGYCPERDYPCWSNLQRAWNATAAHGDAASMNQCWNVTMREFNIPPEIADLCDEAGAGGGGCGVAFASAN